MEHENIRELLLKYIDKETTAEENEKIKEHLSNCEECQQEYEELKTVLSLFNTLEPMEPPEDLKKSIMAKIKNESLPKPWFSSVKNRWISWGATAAIMVIVVGTVSMSGLFSDIPSTELGYKSDSNYGQSEEIMSARFVAEIGDTERVMTEFGDISTDVFEDSLANFLQGGAIANRECDITDESNEQLHIAAMAMGGEHFPEIMENREIISLTVEDLDTSLEYIKNLLDDTVVVSEYGQEAIIIAWTKKDETELVESLGGIGIINVEPFHNDDCIEEFARPEIERLQIFAVVDAVADVINESLDKDEYVIGLPRCPVDPDEGQRESLNALEVENRVMYKIRISVQQE